MTQEVRINLVVEIDTLYTKDDIEQYLNDNISVDFMDICEIEIREEREIYKNE